MHAILASVGTDGDVFPYVGLGAALRACGHRVTLTANEPYRALAAKHDLAFQPLVSEADTHAFLTHPDLWHNWKGAAFLARWGAPLIGGHYRLLAELANDPDAVLIASPGVLAARMVQETLGRPVVSVVLQPWMIPSLAAPPVMPNGVTLPPWAPRPLGRFYWWMFDVLVELLIGRRLQHVRARLRLKPISRIFQWWLSPELVLGLFPNWYGQPQTDWPSQMHLTGFPLFDGGTGQLPPEVLEFCRAGKPPIAFTFGSGMTHAAEYFRAALEACRLFGGRGLLLTKYAHQLPAPLPPFMLHCPYAPFGHLFPHCAAVVHHGGVGTTARALGAGAPQLILPLSFDQPDNAVRVKRLGAGDWLPRGRRKGGHIARALAGLMTPGVRERCRAVASQVANDNGLATAVDWTEQLAAKRRA
jgi:rhamnosyltransferase subunit B